jgi:hypothetical protein
MRFGLSLRVQILFQDESAGMAYATIPIPTLEIKAAI